MFSKQKKWFSWLLVVTMLITIFPVHNLVFAAPGQNQSLNDAMATVANKTGILAPLQGKDIVGEVHLQDIRQEFANATALNLSDNFITKLEEDAVPAFTNIRKDGNLLTADQRKISWSGTIERLKYNPQEIDVAAAYSDMMVAGKPGVTLRTLIDKGLIEELSVGFATPGAPAATIYPETNLGDAKVLPATIGALAAGTHTLNLIVKYKGLPNEPEIFRKTVEVKGLQRLEIENLSDGDTVQPNTDVTVLVSKKGANGEDVPFDAANLTELTVTADPSMGYTQVGATTLQGDKAQVTFKFSQEFTSKPLTFALAAHGVSLVRNISSQAVRLESITLIDKQSGADVPVATVTVNNTTPEKTQNVFVFGGTNVSSFDSNILPQRETGLLEGKYYIKVKEAGKPEADLLDPSWLEVEQPAGGKVAYELKKDADGKVYLSVSAQFEAQGGNDDMLTVKPKAFGPILSNLKVKLFPVVSQKAPEAYYIYEIEDVGVDENEIQALADEDVTMVAGQNYGETVTSKAKVYRVPLSHTQQDGKTEFAVKEGKKKLYYPVAAYNVIQNGQAKEVRKMVPIPVKKTWYQKEKILNNAFTGNPYPFEAVPPYPGVPFVGVRAASSGLIIEAKPKANATVGDIGNVSLAMHHFNNNGLWFEVKWEPKVVQNYVLIGTDHQLTTAKPLSEYNMEDPADKQAVIDEVKRATGDMTYTGFDEKATVKVPIGTDKTFKVLAIYDNGSIEEVGNTNALNPEIPNIVEATGNPKDDDDVRVEGSNGVTLKLIGTPKGGKKDGPSGKPTDAKVGNYGMLSLDMKEIAKVALSLSHITGVDTFAYDNLRLTANDDLTSGEIKGTWKEGNSAQIFQGDGSGQVALQTKFYLVPVFTNIDLNEVKLNELQAGTQNEDLVKKFAFEKDYWKYEINPTAPVGTPKGISISATTGQSDFKITTAGEPDQMNNTGTSSEIEWTLGNTAGPTPDLYKNHEVKLPLTHKETTQVDILEPIYDRIGAFAETDGGKKDEDFDEATTTLKMALEETKHIRIKLTNSNFGSLAPIGDIIRPELFTNGVYFFGSDEPDPADPTAMKYPISSYQPPQPKPEDNAPGRTFSDLYMLYLVSGQKAGLTPVAYVNHADVYGGQEAGREAALQAEQQKIVPKVYQKKNGVYELVDPVTAKLKITAGQVPGVYDIKAEGRGEFRIVFFANHEGTESPLLNIGEDYLPGKNLYHIDVNITQAPIKKVYYYIPEVEGISLQSENDKEKVHINALSVSENQKIFKVYPVAADATFEASLPTGTTMPRNLEELKRYATSKGKTLEDLLGDPESGLSYMKEADFDLQTLASRWMEQDFKNVVVSQADTEADGRFFIKLFVQKADLTDGQTNAGFDFVATDFDKDPNDPAAPAPTLLKPTGKFLPAVQAITIERIDIIQELQDWIHDINPTPLRNPTVIQRGDSMPFGVTYIMARGVERNLTRGEILGTEPTKLVITGDAANPEPMDDVTITKSEAMSGQPAIVKFAPSKVGTYKFYLSATNEKGQPVPAIGQTRVVEFKVEPFIKGEYDLYYGQSLPIEVDAGDDSDNLSFVPRTAGVLDANILASRKLTMDMGWAGVQVPNSEADPTDVYVDVMLNGTKVGEFLVHVHPRALDPNMGHQLLPVSSNANPYLVNNGDNVTLRVRRFFTDGTFDMVDIQSVEFISGYNTDLTETLDNEAQSFVAINSAAPANLSIRPVTGKDDTKDWYGEYKVTAVDGWIGTFYIQKNNAPVNRPVPAYKFYRLEPNGNVTPVISDINIFEQQTTPETLFVIDESNPSDLQLVSDYILGVIPPGMVAYQRFGNMTTSSSITVSDLQNNPNMYPRLKFSPLRAGNVSFKAKDTLGMTEAVANYIIRQGQPLSVRILGPLNRSVNEGDTLNILAEVLGGVNPILQWEESMDGTTWTPIAGQNAPRLTIPNADMSMDQKMYRLKVMDAFEQKISETVVVSVISQGTPQRIEGRIIPAEHRKQVGETASFTLQLTGVPAGANVAYQWRVRTSNGWVTPGVTTDTFTIPAVTAEMHNNQYACIVTVNGIPVDGINRGVLIVVDANGNPIQNTHRVTFSAGAHGSLQGHGASYSLTVVEGQSILATDVPVVLPHSGYQFTGWVPANPAGTVVTGPMTFVAQYSSTPSGGGGPGGGGGPAPTPQPQPIPQPQPTPQPQPERPKTPVLQLNKKFKGAYIAGYPDGTVRPSAQITRAEVSAIFARIMLEQMVDGKAYPSQFKDVAGGKWYSDYIGFLQDFSVLSGYPDGSFKPNNKITRAEFAVIVSKFFELKTTNNKFADVKENHWAKKYIDAAVANALMGGYPDGTFKPDQPITRAEVVTVINKALERTPNKADIDANSANAKRFKDLKPAHWAYYDMIEASTDHTK